MSEMERQERCASASICRGVSSGSASKIRRSNRERSAGASRCAGEELLITSTQPRSELGENVVHALYQHRLALPDQPIGATPLLFVDGAWDGEDIAVLVERGGGGDHGAPFNARFHDECRNGNAADDPVAAGKIHGVRFGSHFIFGDQSPRVRDPFRQRAVLGRVDPVNARANDRDGAALGPEGRAMRARIDAACQTADDGQAFPGQVRGKTLCMMKPYEEGLRVPTMAIE